MPLPLEGMLVVSLEQAVAAPMCSCRLADAGARVIKIERPEGDFAREYDHLVNGQCSYFVWLNRGKQSLVLDLTKPDDKALLEAMLAKADVFVQNLKPGAVAKLGFAIDRLRRDYPRLIVCSVSGYGDTGPYAARKAYDMLIQAEAGVASVTGGPEAPARVGVSVCDIAAGMNAYQAVLEALLARSHTGQGAARKAYDMLIQAEAGVASVTGGPEAPARVGVSVCDIAAGMNAYQAVLEALLARSHTGQGAAISVSMFDGMADWMATPLLQHEGGAPPKRIGLSHTSIAPYGVFKTRDGADILIAIQSDREWRILAEQVMGDKALAADPNYATNIERVKRRAETDGRVQAAFGALGVNELQDKLAAVDIAFGRVNGPAELAEHPHLRRITVGSPNGPISYPAPAAQWADAVRRYGAVPALGEHSDQIRAEFGATARR